MTEKDIAEQQATAIAEAILPQLDKRIEARLDVAAKAQEDAFKQVLINSGLLDANGEMISRPPVATPTVVKPFASFGEQLRAIRAAEMSGDPTRIASIEKLMSIQAATGMSEGVGADGGFLVFQDYATEIGLATHDVGQVYNLIPPERIIPLSGNANGTRLPAIDEQSRADGSRWGGVQGFWAGEGATLTASQPKFRRVQLELEKLTILSYATDEQLEDTPQLEAVVRAGFTEEFAFKLDDALINGTGVGMPLGIMNAPALITVAKESGQPAATIQYENVEKMWARMWARSRKNAVWFVNQDVEPQLHSMALVVGVGGVPVWMPAGGLSGKPFDTLFGRPVVVIEQANTLGSLGDIILADMSQYWGISKGGVNFASSIHVQFVTDETAYRATMRTDFEPQWNSTLTPFKGTNTISPFVTLAAR